jgi:hypothetical protein
MSGLGSFLALKNLTPGLGSCKPLHVDDAHKSPKKFKEWFTQHLIVVEAFNQYRIWNEWNNLLWYTGEILDFMDGVRTYADFTGFKDKQRRTVPFWVNHISDLIDKRSNDLASLKPNFEISPPESNITEKTRSASRVSRPILSHVRTFNNLDLMFDENERSNVLYGSAIMQAEWNSKIGDKRKPVTRKEIALANAGGWLEWEGEVEIKQVLPWHIMPFPARKAFDSPLAIQIYDILNVDEAREKYKDNSIQPDKRTNLYHFASPFEADILPDETVIYRVVNKPTEFMPEGAVIYCTHNGDVIKSKTQITKYPYSHNDFPWEVHTDITAHGRIFPYSIMNNLKPLQWTYNLLGGMIRKAIFLTAHPKWMLPRGGANIASLGNGTTVVQHKPGQQPQLVRYDVVGADTTSFRDNVKGEMQKLAGSFGLSNGDIPPNTRSGIQISRLQNIEKMNRSYQMGKRNDFMRRVLVKALSIAADYYPKTSPEHLIRLLGKENAENMDVLRDQKVSNQTVLKIQNSSGFSDDLAGRLEEVAFANEKLPGLLTVQEQADIIGVRSSQKFYDVTTAALRMAEAENEAFNDGKPVDAPLIEQDHIQHWQTHVIDMQTQSHAILPKKMQQKKLDHLGMHEMMMEQLANSPYGMAFKQRLATLERYPLVYKPNVDLAAIEAERTAEKQAMGMQPPQEAQGAPAAPSGDMSLSTAPEEPTLE